MEHTTAQGLAMAGIGALGTAFGLLINWLRDRDKLRYDSKLQALEVQNGTQAEQITALIDAHEACKQEHADARQKLRACAEKHETTELRLREVEAAIAQLKTSPVPPTTPG
jgi:hypothetical protein